MQITRFATCVALLLFLACPTAAAEPSQSLEEGFESILSGYRAATIGAALLQDGALVWTGYFGEQAPGVPAGPSTMFNVASITKTVTAELVVRLASDGTIALDEPMSPRWIDPDIIDDPRHRQLTPELAITHRTGLPNWRYMDPEFKLRFVTDPGREYGYSGEGMDYVARFLERKTGESFPALVLTHVLEPIGIDDLSISREDWVIDRLVLPVDETGQRHAPYCSSAAGNYCLGDGDWSAADELATTVEAYAQFMIAVMQGDGLSSQMRQKRFSVITSHADDPVVGCPFSDATRCPVRQGYGLGWEVFEFENQTIVSHGGSDWSERSMAYFDPATGDGIILFINGPTSTSVGALIEGVRLLDSDSGMADMYQGWIDRYGEEH